ncbi:MAG TPA: PEP-CTERM sorting domain-containing protein [Blastocatellia bacterium]|nr:PEP-CTERM sorting domain-containing protein [Blastocatellia bacterium]
MEKLIVLFALVIASLTHANADTVILQLTGVSSVQQSGYYVGPATGNVNGTPITMVCDDFAHHVSVGQTWSATINTFADLSGARFGALTDAVAKYKQAAWLFDQFALHPSATSDIQFAIWSLFTPATATSTGALSWVNQAQQQNLGNYDFSGFRLYTPVDSTSASPQEFIAKLPGAPIPEPATLLLLGSGLAGIASLLKKRNRDKDSTDK